MKLYDADWAPSPRRVRLFLAEKGVAVERVAVDLRADEQLGAAYLERNPRGLVPALELDTGEVITESVAICRYFEALHPDPALFGTSPLDIARIESWTRRVESDGYAAAVYAMRNTRPAFADRGAAGNWPAIAQIPELAQRAQIMWGAFVEAIDAQLAGREWLATDAYSFADVTLLVTIDFARAAKLEVAERFASLNAWHARASARPSSKA